MNFYKRFIGDYQRDTGHLSMAEHGAYTLLLDVHYATEKPLPSNKQSIYRLLRAIDKSEQIAIDRVLDEFWTETDVGWVNPKALELIADKQTRSDKAKGSAEKRWSGDADARPNAQEGDANAHASASENGRDSDANASEGACDLDANASEGACDLDANAYANASKNRCDPDASHSQRPDTKARHQSQTQTPDPPDSPSQASDSGGSVERPDLGATPPVALAPRRRGNSAKPPSAVAVIFDYWRNTLGHPRARLDDKRRKVIGRALKLGYTAAELCEAIRGCAVTPHNMGINDRGTKYDALGLILRDADHIDRFIRNAKDPPQPRNDAEARFLHNVANAETAMRLLAERDQQDTTDDRH